MKRERAACRKCLPCMCLWTSAQAKTSENMHSIWLLCRPLFDGMGVAAGNYKPFKRLTLYYGSQLNWQHGRLIDGGYTMFICFNVSSWCTPLLYLTNICRRTWPLRHGVHMLCGRLAWTPNERRRRTIIMWVSVQRAQEQTHFPRYIHIHLMQN